MGACRPYLTLMTEDAPQREHPLCEVFNGLRWIVRAGSSWRMMPHDLPPWDVVYQQTQRWLKAEVFHWMSRFRRLARDYERLPETLAGLHYLAFVILMLKNVAEILA
jgi:transposase